MKYLTISLLIFCLLSSHALQANSCLTEKDVTAQIIDSSQSENGEVDELRISLKGENKKVFTEALLEYSSLEDILSFVDIDFDGTKEILIKYDSDPSHDITHTVLKISCNKLVPHPVFPELGFYDIDKKNKMLITTLKDGFTNIKKNYCFKPDGYLCSEAIAINDQISLLKKYDINGGMLFQGAVDNSHSKDRMFFHIQEKSYLYNLIPVVHLGKCRLLSSI